MNEKQALARAQTLAALLVLTIKLLEPQKPWRNDAPCKK